MDGRAWTSSMMHEAAIRHDLTPMVTSAAPGTTSSPTVTSEGVSGQAHTGPLDLSV